eukprot:scaffold6363_cov25-Tisochrysis_lutea.AAC.6
MAATNCTSTISRNVHSFRSYQPSWSIHWRSSSMGGCAPYVSSAGMLRSSTNTMHFFPSGGPKMPLRRLSSWPSIMPWHTSARVCAEKLRKMGLYVAGERPCNSRSRTSVVLPVPVDPHTKSGVPRAKRTSVR